MTLDELIADAVNLQSEHNLNVWLIAMAGKVDGNPALSLLIIVLSDMPEEIAALFADKIDTMATELHADTNGPRIARAVAATLRMLEGS